MTKLQHKHPLSTGALFKVMLHNSKSQRGATSHCISVLKQSETAASRWITREDNKKKHSLYTLFLQHSSSNAIYHVPHSLLAEGNDASSVQLTFCLPHKSIWGRTTRYPCIFFFSFSQPSVLSEVMQVFSLSFKLSFSCFSWGLNQHRICRKQMIRTSWHSVKHRKKKVT